MTLLPRSAALCSATTALLLLGACGKHQPAAPAKPSTSASAAATHAAIIPEAAITAAIPKAAPGASATTPSRATPVATPLVAAATNAPLTVAKLTLGNAVNAAHEVTHASNSFAANDRAIYASVATEGRSSGVTLNAKWSYLEGQGQLISSITESIATDGAAVTTFKVENPDLWPAGKYKVEISLDGKPVIQQDFEITQR